MSEREDLLEHAEYWGRGAQRYAELAEQILEEPVAAPVVHVPPAAPKLAAVSARKVWKYRVVNEALIPRQYLTVDHAAIGRVVSALGGRAKIPGIEVYEETVIAAGGRR